MADIVATVRPQLEAGRLPADIQRQINSRKYSINDIKFNSQPLGRIKGQLGEFQKSLDASNARVLAFGASAGAIFAISTALKAAVRAGIEVQKTLSEINVILNQSTSGLQKFGNDLFDVANRSGQAFSVAAKAAQELARQGLGVEQTLKRTSDALVLARLSGLSVEDAVTSITATLNSFNAVALDSTKIINQLAAVDARFAVSSADLAEALKRVGSTASDIGVSFEELISLVTAAQQTTARGGAVIGNAFKSIFTRLQRPKVLDQIEGLGIAVKNLDGSTKPLLNVLGELANKFDDLTSAQQSQISELIGGVYQINILRATLGDLGKSYSIYSNALNVANTATDEATRRNEELNKTLSSKLARTLNELTKVGANFSGAVFEPSINKILNTLTNSLNTGDVGEKIGESILSGIGKVLSGPGLTFGTAIFLQLGKRFLTFLNDSIKQVSGFNSAKENQLNLEKQILGFIKQQKGLEEAIYSGQIGQNKLEELFVQRVAEGNRQLQLQVGLTSKIASNLSRMGFTYTGEDKYAAGIKSPNVKAVGHVPEMAEKLGALNAGYKPGKVKQINLEGKKAYYNTAEQVVPFGNSAFIIPPSGSHARKNYDKQLRAKGVDPKIFNSFGKIPNLAGPEPSELDLRAILSQSIVAAQSGNLGPLKNIATGRFASFKLGNRVIPTAFRSPEFMQQAQKQLDLIESARVGVDVSKLGAGARSEVVRKVNREMIPFEAQEVMLTASSGPLRQFYHPSRGGNRGINFRGKGLETFGASSSQTFVNSAKSRMTQAFEGIISDTGLRNLVPDLPKSSIDEAMMKPGLHQSLGNVFDSFVKQVLPAEAAKASSNARFDIPIGVLRNPKTSELISKMFGIPTSNIGGAGAELKYSGSEDELKSMREKIRAHYPAEFKSSGHIPNLAGKLSPWKKLIKTLRSKDISINKNADFGYLSTEEPVYRGSGIAEIGIPKKSVRKDPVSKSPLFVLAHEAGHALGGEKALKHFTKNTILAERGANSTALDFLQNNGADKDTLFKFRYWAKQQLSRGYRSDESPFLSNGLIPNLAPKKGQIWNLLTENKQVRIEDILGKGLYQVRHHDSFSKTVREKDLALASMPQVMSYMRWRNAKGQYMADGSIPNLANVSLKKTKDGFGVSESVLKLGKKSHVRYSIEDDKINLDYIKSGKKGDAFRMFKALARTSRRIGRPIFSTNLIPQKEQKDNLDPNADNYSNLIKMYPHLRYRDIPGLKTRGDFYFGQEEFKFRSLSGLREHVNKLNPDALFGALTAGGGKTYISDVYSNFFGGNAPLKAIKDAFEREKKAGYTPQLGFDNRIGPLVYGKEQGSAQKAIKQHMAMGESLSDIRKAGKSRGHIPNLAPDDYSGAGFDIASGIGIFASQLMFMQRGDREGAKIQLKLEAQNRILDKQNQDGRDTSRTLNAIGVLNTKRAKHISELEQREKRQGVLLKASLLSAGAGGLVQSAIGSQTKAGRTAGALGESASIGANIAFALPGPVGAAAGALIGVATAASKIYKIFTNEAPKLEKVFDEERAYLQKVGDATNSFAQIFDKLSAAYAKQSSSAETLVKLNDEYIKALAEVPQEYRALVASASDAAGAQRIASEALKERAAKFAQADSIRGFASRLDNSRGLFSDSRIFDDGDTGKRQIQELAETTISKSLKTKEFTSRLSSSRISSAGDLEKVLAEAKQAGEIGAETADQLMRFAREASGLQGAFDKSAEEAETFAKVLVEQATEINNIVEREKALKPIREQQNRILDGLRAKSKAANDTIAALNQKLTILSTRGLAVFQAQQELLNSSRGNTARNQVSIIETLASSFGESISDRIKVALDNSLGLFKIQSEGASKFKESDLEATSRLFENVKQLLSESIELDDQGQFKNPGKADKVTGALAQLSALRGKVDSPEQAGSVLSKFIQNYKELIGDQTNRLETMNLDIVNELVSTRAKLDQDFREQIRLQLVNNQIALATQRANENANILGGGKGFLNPQEFTSSLKQLIKGANLLSGNRNNNLFAGRGAVDLFEGLSGMGFSINNKGGKILKDLAIEGRAREIKENSLDISNFLQVKGAGANNEKERQALFAAAASVREFAGPRSNEAATEQINRIIKLDELPDNVAKQVVILDNIYKLLSGDISNALSAGGAASNEILGFSPNNSDAQIQGVIAARRSAENNAKQIEKTIRETQKKNESYNNDILKNVSSTAKSTAEFTKAATTNSTIYVHDTHLEKKFEEIKSKSSGSQKFGGSKIGGTALQALGIGGGIAGAALAAKPLMNVAGAGYQYLKQPFQAGMARVSGNNGGLLKTAASYGKDAYKYASSKVPSFPALRLGGKTPSSITYQSIAGKSAQDDLFFKLGGDKGLVDDLQDRYKTVGKYGRIRAGGGAAQAAARKIINETTGGNIKLPAKGATEYAKQAVMDLQENISTKNAPINRRIVNRSLNRDVIQQQTKRLSSFREVSKASRGTGGLSGGAFSRGGIGTQISAAQRASGVVASSGARTAASAVTRGLSIPLLSELVDYGSTALGGISAGENSSGALSDRLLQDFGAENQEKSLFEKMMLVGPHVALLEKITGSSTISNASANKVGTLDSLARKGAGALGFKVGKGALDYSREQAPAQERITQMQEALINQRNQKTVPAKNINTYGQNAVANKYGYGESVSKNRDAFLALGRNSNSFIEGSEENKAFRQMGKVLGVFSGDEATMSRPNALMPGQGPELPADKNSLAEKFKIYNNANKQPENPIEKAKKALATRRQMEPQVGTAEYYNKNQGIMDEANRTIGYANGQPVYARQDLAFARNLSGPAKEMFLGQQKTAKQAYYDSMPPELKIRKQYEDSQRAVQSQTPSGKPEEKTEDKALADAIGQSVASAIGGVQSQVAVTWPTLNINLGGGVSVEGGDAKEKDYLIGTIKNQVFVALGRPDLITPLPTKAGKNDKKE
jgi:TP901 family phage tail tape measure protein